MFKELLLAITLGALLGFGATGTYFAIHKNSSAVSRNTGSSPTPIIIDASLSTTASPTPENLKNILSPTPPTSDSGSSVILETPKNGDIVNSSQVKITGTAAPGSTIIIITPVDTFSAAADAQGSFSTTVDLETGVNIIKITSIDSHDNQSELETMVTYSTAKI